MYRLRNSSLALVCVVAFAACTKSQPEASLSGRAAPAPASRPVVANFEGEYDPATGTFTVAMISPDLTTPGGLSISLPFRDGTTGSNPDNTFELANVPDPGYAPSTGSSVCGAGVSGFEGWVQVQSFFRNQTLRNVHAEITYLSDTSNSGCNSAATAPAGTSNGLGLWSYGDVAPGQTVAMPWRFRTVNSQAYTFRGRVMADLDPVVHLSGAPEFDWTPTALAAKRSFKETGTTTVHVVWNGSNFVDTLGHVTFVSSTATPATSTYSAIPGAPYAGGFTDSVYYVSTVGDGGNYVTTAGNFTVCAKIKPGAHPGNNGIRRVYVGKGKSEPSTEGWSLMQMHSAYCYHYRTVVDDTASPVRGDVMTFVDLATYNLSAYAYDYVCGGRSGNAILVMGNGKLGYFDVDGVGRHSDYEDGTFSSPSSLPLVIGAYADGTSAAVDGGVYEVIFDSRAATLDVMREIVAAAENAGLDGSPTSFLLVNPNDTNPARVAPTPVRGNDNVTYTVPPFAVPPAALDGSGLLDPGIVVTFTRPVSENTGLDLPTGTGFCVGVQVQPTGAWTDVDGGMLRWAQPDPNFGSTAELSMHFSGGQFGFLAPGYSTVSSTSTASTWTAGQHTFKACVEAFRPGGYDTHTTLYVDNVQDGQTHVAWTITNFSRTTGNPSPYLEIGTGRYGPLTGARIRRVFICPTSVAANCN